MIKTWKTAAIAMMAASAYCYAPLVAATDPAAAVKARQQNYKEIGGAFKAINDELKSGSPDMNTVRPAARDLAARAERTLGHFPKGSGPGGGISTRAKAEIWTSPAEFIRTQNLMITSAKTLNAALARGDMATMKAAVSQLGGTCKSCHDRYREPV